MRPKIAQNKKERLIEATETAEAMSLAVGVAPGGDDAESIYKLIRAVSSAGSSQQQKKKKQQPTAAEAAATRAQQQAIAAKRKEGALFGPGGSRRADPAAFTTKGAGDARREELRRTKQAQAMGATTTAMDSGSGSGGEGTKAKTKTKAALPGRGEAGQIAERTARDFVAGNREEAAAARRAHAATAAGEDDVNWTQKEEYGRPPEYLARVRAEVEAERAAREPPVQAPRMRELTQDERDALLAGLKKRWDETHAALVRLPMASDSASARQRKEELEKQLAAIERDIERMLKPHVFVENDPSSSPAQ